MVRPHLEYANSVWAPYNKGQSRVLERVQRRATRLVNDCKDLSYVDRLRFLDLYSLKYRRYRGDLIQCYKIINKVDDIDASTFYTFNDNVTRNADNKLFVKRCNKDIKKYSFSHRSAKYWNSLSITTRSAESLDAFKSLLDKDDNKLIGLFDHDKYF